MTVFLQLYSKIRCCAVIAFLVIHHNDGESAYTVYSNGIILQAMMQDCVINYIIEIISHLNNYDKKIIYLLKYI